MTRMSRQYPHIPADAMRQYEARALTPEDLAVCNRLWRDHPKCAVCGWPLCAGQHGTHLSCRTPNPPRERNQP
jgi:hypothetical protein